MNARATALATILVVTLSIVSVNCFKSDIVRECYDGCPNGYFAKNDSCYVIPRIKVTWGQAVSYCKALGSQLLTIETRDEQMYLEEEMQKHYGSDGVFWFAATDMLQEGKWRWAVSLSPVLEQFWKPGQPDNKVSDDKIHHQHCATLGYKWDDEDCKKHHLFVCEMARF